MTIQPTYPTAYDGTLDISPITKHNWKSLAAREKWKGPLDTCKRNAHQVQLLAAAAPTHPRQVARIDRSRLRDPDVIDTLVDHEMTVEVAHDNAFVARRDDAIAAEQACDAHTADAHAVLGDLLGYPECCIDAYREHGPANEVPIYEMACHSENAVENPDDQSLLLESPDPLLNVIWQYLGYSFLDHIPCSFDCEQSRDLAAANGQSYRALGLGDEAEALWEFLATPTTWTGYHGLSNIRNGYLIGSTNTPAYWDEKTVVWQDDHAKKLL